MLRLLLSAENNLQNDAAIQAQALFDELVKMHDNGDQAAKVQRFEGDNNCLR